VFCTFGLVKDPRSRLKRRPVAKMLMMAAREQRTPVALVVGVE
jgi:hypothetical protein